LVDGATRWIAVGIEVSGIGAGADEATAVDDEGAVTVAGKLDKVAGFGADDPQAASKTVTRAVTATSSERRVTATSVSRASWQSG
jgi:hypothetical protein